MFGMGRMTTGAMIGAAWGGYQGIDNGAGGFFGGMAAGAGAGALMGRYAGRLNRMAVNKLGYIGRRGTAGVWNKGFGQSDQLGPALAGTMGRLMSSKGIGRGTVGRQAISAIGIGSAGLIGSSVMDSNRGY